MPKFAYAEPGYDPRTADLPMRGLTLKGCVMIVGAILLTICIGGAGVVAALPKLIPPTKTPTFTSTPGPSPTPTNTFTPTASSTPTWVYTPAEIVIVTKVVTVTFTASPTATATFTASPTPPDVITATSFRIDTNTPRPPTRTPSKVPTKKRR